MRCHLEPVLAAVGGEGVGGVDPEVAEGVDGDEDMGDVGLSGCQPVSTGARKGEENGA